MTNVQSDQGDKRFGGVTIRGLPTFDDSHRGALGRASSIVDVLVARWLIVNGLADQSDLVMSDVASGTALLGQLKVIRVRPRASSSTRKAAVRPMK